MPTAARRHVTRWQGNAQFKLGLLEEQPGAECRIALTSHVSIAVFCSHGINMITVTAFATIPCRVFCSQFSAHFRCAFEFLSQWNGRMDGFPSARRCRRGPCLYRRTAAEKKACQLNSSDQRQNCTRCKNAEAWRVRATRTT